MLHPETSDLSPWISRAHCDDGGPRAEKRAMKLCAVNVKPSPLGSGRIRLVGDVSYRDPRRSAEALWFDVPGEYSDGLSATGNPWLACLLPLAVTLGEPLELSLPVDPALVEGAAAIMEIWRSWYPGVCEPVPIEADLLEPGLP